MPATQRKANRGASTRGTSSHLLLQYLQVNVDGCIGAVNTFIVEPFVPHEAEYYLSIQSERLGNVISFSEAGGVEIEANWDSVKTVTIPTMGEASGDTLAPLLGGLPLELRSQMEAFIKAVYVVRCLKIDQAGVGGGGGTYIQKVPTNYQVLSSRHSLRLRSSVRHCSSVDVHSFPRQACMSDEDNPLHKSSVCFVWNPSRIITSSKPESGYIPTVHHPSISPNIIIPIISVTDWLRESLIL